MTVNQRIIEALSGFGYPVVADFYGKGNKEYITFDFPSENGDDFGCDAPGEVVTNVAIHWFLSMETDYLATKNQIRNALYKNGFTFPEVTYVTDPDDSIRHIVFECETIDTEALEETEV